MTRTTEVVSGSGSRGGDEEESLRNDAESVEARRGHLTDDRGSKLVGAGRPHEAGAWARPTGGPHLVLLLLCCLWLWFTKGMCVCVGACVCVCVCVCVGGWLGGWVGGWSRGWVGGWVVGCVHACVRACGTPVMVHNRYYLL